MFGIILKLKSVRRGSDPVLVLEIPLGDRHFARYPVKNQEEAIARYSEFAELNPELFEVKEIIRGAA